MHLKWQAYPEKQKPERYETQTNTVTDALACGGDGVPPDTYRLSQGQDTK